MRSVFGWSLPPGVTTLPGEEPDYEQPRCGTCGRYMKDDVKNRDEERTYVEFYTCGQGHETIVYSCPTEGEDW